MVHMHERFLEEISVGDAAIKYDLTPSQITKLVRAGKIQGRKFGRDWVLPLASVEAYQRSNPRPGRPPGRAIPPG